MSKTVNPEFSEAAWEALQQMQQREPDQYREAVTAMQQLPSDLTVFAGLDDLVNTLLAPGAENNDAIIS